MRVTHVLCLLMPGSVPPPATDADVKPEVQKIASRSLSLFKLLCFATCVSSVAFSSSVFAEGSSIPYGGGGPIPFRQIISQYNQTGELFRIEGQCQSSCTTLLAIRNVCVDQNATLLFHAWLAPSQRGQKPDPAKQSAMLSSYKPSLRNFLVTNHYVDTFDFRSISGRDIIQKFGYRECPRK